MATQVVEEPALVEVDAQQLRDLVDHDDEPDPRLESDQHRLGDEVGDEAEPQERGQHEDDADQSSVSVAEAVISAAGSPPGRPGRAPPPIRIAIVVVVLTLSGRDVPSTA